MLHRLMNLLKNLLVYPQRMRENLEASRGLVFSQSLLLALVNKGLTRDAAYRLVQRAAMLVWEGEENFFDVVHRDPDIRRHLSDAELAELFDYRHHLRHVDVIYRRVFG